MAIGNFKLNEESGQSQSPYRNLWASVLHRWLVDATGDSLPALGRNPDCIKIEALNDIREHFQEFSLLCGILDIEPWEIIDLVDAGVRFTFKPGRG